MTDINIIFCRNLYNSVMKELREDHDDTIKPRTADIYIETGKSAKRWFTFEFRDFYWEGYVDNIWDGKAQAWIAYMDKMGYKSNLTEE